MNLPVSPLLLLPGLVGGLLSLWMTAVTLHRRPGAGWRYLAATGVAVALWCFGQPAWVLATDARAAWHVAQVQHVAMAAASVGWLLYAIAQTGRQRWFHRPAIALVMLVPALLLVVAFGYEPGAHNPLWTGFIVEPGQAPPRVLHGELFRLFTFHSYALLVCGAGLLVRYYAQSRHFRGELLVAGAMPVALLLLNVLLATEHWPMALDPSPLGFGIGFALFGWAMEHRRLFDLRPIGRSMAMDCLQDGILIADNHGRVLESNPAAALLLGDAAASIVGQSVHDLLPVEPGLGERSAMLEIDLPVDEDRSRRVQLGVAPVCDEAGVRAGSVLTLRDVTRERTAQQQLLAAHGRLRELNRDLQRMALTDALTGLANRRVLVGRLEQEFARARRHATPLALVMIDLDHFKQVNDTHGHLTGDEVLRAAAGMLLALKRPPDLAARYGGEELVLMLPGADEAGACGAAARAWSALRELAHRDPQGQRFSVSASLGIACLRASDAGIQDLLARADAALYAAKGAGRDRVFVATGERLIECVPRTLDGPTRQLQPRDH